jgi:hypothetical protein
MSEHEQFVWQDAGRIFFKMLSHAEDDVPGPDMFVLYSPRDLDRLPPCPGVYIGFNEHGRCQYVGESACVGRRIGAFGSRDELRHCKYIAVILADDERQMRRLEFYFIGLLDPVFNKQIRPTGKRHICNADQLTWNPDRRMWSLNGSYALIDRSGNVRDARGRKKPS